MTSPHQDLTEEKIVKRGGAGVKGKPFRYWILRKPAAQHAQKEPVFLSAHPFRDAERNEAPNAAQKDGDGMPGARTDEELDRLVSEYDLDLNGEPS